MLRWHSQLKVWYHQCTAMNDKEYEEGFFMDLSAFWKFINNNRLINGKANLANVSRLLSKYGEKEFSLHFDEAKLKDEIELIQKYDFESSEIENELSRYDDNSYVSSKIEGLLMDEQLYQKKRAKNQYNSERILLFRTFVNGIVSKSWN